MKTISITFLFVCLSTGHHFESTETRSMAVSPEALLRRYQLECVEETRVNPDIIASIKRGKWQGQWMQLRILKDWALCVLMKNKVMTKEGVFKIDIALSNVPLDERDFVEEQVDRCITPKAVPARDIALGYIKCFQRRKSIYSTFVSAFE